jgi:ribosomal subunit interface protein
MQVPMQISFRNMDRSDSVDADVREKVAKLEEFCDRITSCNVVVEAPHRHHHQGNVYLVRIHISVPHRELVVNREPAANHAHEDVYVAVRDAFKAIRRQLEDYVREQRGDTKEHLDAPHGRITKFYPQSDYGFIETPDHREVYFHANSLLNMSFEDLVPDLEVRFLEEQGEKGPQATSVHVLGRHHHLPIHG